jgi:hypothetical protein
MVTSRRFHSFYARLLSITCKDWQDLKTKDSARLAVLIDSSSCEVGATRQNKD